MSKPIPLKELIALDNELPEPDGSLRCGVTDTEIAIEKLLSEARRLGRGNGEAARQSFRGRVKHSQEDPLPIIGESQVDDAAYDSRGNDTRA